MVRTGWSLYQFGFADVRGNGQESVEWGGYPEFCMQAVRDYDAAQDCEVGEE